MSLGSIFIFDNPIDDWNFALFVLRFVGLVFAAHGAQKVFGWFDGKGLAGQIGQTRGMGIKFPEIMGRMAAANEFVGGLLLFTGFLMPLGAAMLLASMTVAIGIVHLRNGFFAHGGGYEYPLVLCIVGFVLAVMGPGEWSLDNAFGIVGLDDGYSWGLGWGLIALVVGVGGGVATVMTRTPPQQPPGQGQPPSGPPQQA